MSAGERTYSSATATIEKRSFPLRPEGDRDFKLLGDTAQIAQPKEGGLSYVKVQADSLDENAPKGRAFLSFFLDTRPDTKGKVTFLSENGIFAMAKALGDELQCGDREQTYVDKQGNQQTALILDPEAVKAYLVAHDGAVFRAREYIKQPTEKAKKQGYTEPQNAIARFILPEGEGAPDVPQAETAAPEATGGEAPPPPRRGPPPPRKR